MSIVETVERDGYVRECIADAIAGDRDRVHAERVELYRRLVSA